IIDRSIPRLRQLDDIFGGRVHTRYSTVEALEEECFSADIVVGAVLIPGAAAPKLVSREMLSGMKKGSVLVDVAIDQGGCFETSYATTHAVPTYEVDGVIHYCVANMPGAVPVTSAHALNNATLHYGLQLADKGLKALIDDHHLRNGLNVHKGKITNRAVAEALGYELVEPKAVLAA
ncbi:MAG: alanine dehydrogenase, partial [Mesorhizobium sp.]